MQRRVDILEIFKKKGWAFVVSDENDKCLRMPKLADYSWSMADFEEEVDAPQVDAPEEDADAPEELATVAEERESDDEGDKGEESSDEEEEEVDPGPWEDKEPWCAVTEPTAPKAKLYIANKYLTRTGWDVGRILEYFVPIRVINTTTNLICPCLAGLMELISPNSILEFSKSPMLSSKKF